MTPTSLGILLAALPADRRLVGVRVWAAVGAIAAAIGPTVGGLLTELSWRWVFLINVPVGIVIFVTAARVVRGGPVDEDTAVPDLLGAGLVAAAAGLLALGLVKSHEWGWTGGRTWIAFGLAAVSAAAFAWRSSRHPAPVIDPALLRVRTFRWSILAMFLFDVDFAANLLVGVLWLEQVWGHGVVRTGLAVAVGPLLVPVTARWCNDCYPECRRAVWSASARSSVLWAALLRPSAWATRPLPDGVPPRLGRRRHRGRLRVAEPDGRLDARSPAHDGRHRQWRDHDGPADRVRRRGERPLRPRRR